MAQLHIDLMLFKVPRNVMEYVSTALMQCDNDVFDRANTAPENIYGQLSLANTK